MYSPSAERLLVGCNPAKTSPGVAAHPFVSRQQHRLRQVERSETRIYRNHDECVRDRDLVRLETVTLAPEQHPAPLAPADPLPHFDDGLLRRQHGFAKIPLARRRGPDPVQIGNALFQRS